MSRKFIKPKYRVLEVFKVLSPSGMEVSEQYSRKNAKKLVDRLNKARTGSMLIWKEG